VSSYVLRSNLLHSDNYIQTPTTVRTSAYGTSSGNIYGSGYGSYQYSGSGNAYATSIINPGSTDDIRRYKAFAEIKMIKRKPKKGEYYSAAIILQQFNKQ